LGIGFIFYVCVLSKRDSMFKVIPAIDLKNKKCVSLVQGIPGTERVSLNEPLDVALRWVAEGAGILHIIDLDGALKGRRLNSPIIESIAKNFDVEMQVGGGIRSKEDATGLLAFGVDRVILGTAAINNPSLVKELALEFGSERIMVALDSKNGRVTTHGWAKSLAFTAVELGKKFEELGAGSILFTDIDTEGLLQGVNPVPTKELVQVLNIPVIASGGITTLSDIATIRETRAKGVVVGAALYVEKFTLREALAMEVR
jgi:phosphoribosylformimino-5-aminoimidazole carboxamide ribotide isomerase